MNQVILIGKISKALEVKDSKNGYRLGNFLLEVDRNYTNAEGEVDSDMFQVTIWRNLVDEFEARYQVGDLIALRGRLQANNYYKDDNEIYYRAEIVADKIIAFNNR